MQNRIVAALLLAVPLAVPSEAAQAATWQVCRMELRISEVLKRPATQLHAQVLKVRPASATAECPEVGASITFTPETADYQTMLPRRKWPQKGQSMQIDYRYLDGICKGDGHEHPCRIKHYPVSAENNIRP